MKLSLPLKLAGALNDTLLPSNVAVISVPPDMLNVVLSPSSTSLLDKLKDPAPSSSKDTSDTLASTGASLTGVTVKTNVSASERLPSLTVTVNDSLPLKFSDGVNVKSLPETLDVTSLPPSILYVSKSPSISDADNNKLRIESSSTLLFPITDKTGSSFTGLTVTVIP